jgi:hypothetical protein
MAACAHWRAITGLTGKPSRMADGVGEQVFERQGAKAFGQGFPGRHRPGGDGVPAHLGHVLQARKALGDQAWAAPQAFRPCSWLPSHTRAKASPPMPFIVGSTTVKVMAAASAASMALPPRAIAARPAQRPAAGWWTPHCAPTQAGGQREREGSNSYALVLAIRHFHAGQPSQRHLGRLDHLTPAPVVGLGQRRQPAPSPGVTT